MNSNPFKIFPSIFVLEKLSYFAERLSFSGNLKLINKENSTNSSDIQKFKVSYCLDLGSSCTSCHDRDQQTDEIHHRVCKQEFREIELWVLGDNGKDQVIDSFLVPDGCHCISV